MERRTAWIEGVHYSTRPTCHLVNYEDADIEFVYDEKVYEEIVYDEEEPLITRPPIPNPLLFKQKKK